MKSMKANFSHPAMIIRTAAFSGFESPVALWESGAGGWKRENWMENIEKVEPLWIENSNGKTRNFGDILFTYWDFRYKIMRNLNANTLFVVKCFKKARTEKWWDL